MTSHFLSAVKWCLLLKSDVLGVLCRDCDMQDPSLNRKLSFLAFRHFSILAMLTFCFSATFYMSLAVSAEGLKT